METAKYELGQAQNGNSWLDGWNKLKEEPNTEALYRGAWTLVQGRRKRNV